MTSILSIKGEPAATSWNAIFEKITDFSEFFTAFLKSTFNFEYFEKKDEPESVCISEIIN